MADKVFRRSLTAGVALAGAGVIALGSVAVLPDDEIVVAAVAPRVVSVEVEHVNFAEYAQILAAGATAALEQSADGLFRKAPELWATVSAGWPDADLTHWNYALVADMLLAPVAPLVIGPFNDAVAEVLARQFPALETEIRQLPELIEYTAVRLVGPFLSAIGGAGMAHSEIFYSMTTGQLQPFFEAVVRAPFHVVDGLLNGGYGDLGPLLPGREGDYIPAPGILTPWGEEPAPRDIKTPEDVESAAPAESELVEAEPAEVESPEPGPTALSVAEEPESVVAEETSTGSAVEEAAETDKNTAEAEAEKGTSAEQLSDKRSPRTRSSIQQRIKDLRESVDAGVKKLTGAEKGSVKAETDTVDKADKPGKPDKADKADKAAGASDAGRSGGETD